MVVVVCPRLMPTAHWLTFIVILLPPILIEGWNIFLNDLITFHLNPKRSTELPHFSYHMLRSPAMTS